MKRFRFRLQRLLDLREQEVDAARRELAAARQAVATAEAGLRTVEGLVRRRLDDAARQEALGSPALDFVLRRLQIAGLLRTLAEARAGLEAARQVEAERRQELVAALGRARTLERLRDRRREEWRAEAARAEQAELDELALRPPGAFGPVAPRLSLSGTGPLGPVGELALHLSTSTGKEEPR
ncbi:MAG: flagellar export protein FliJ [Firmicutes bacterium]|nr:flagellar export protein FliJ [Bacillota bacterium]